MKFNKELNHSILPYILKTFHLIYMALFLAKTGCVIPAKISSSHPVPLSGIIFDSKTHQPIPVASVMYKDMPSSRTFTDSDGIFMITNEYSEIHWIPWIPPCGTVPPYVSPIFQIEASGYKRTTVEYRPPSWADSNDLFSVFMIPLGD